VIGGLNPDATAWKEAINVIGRLVRDNRDGLESQVNVNVVYHVPGDVTPRMDAHGVEVTRCRRRDSHVLVAVEVPYEATGDLGARVFDWLQEAVEVAATYCRDHGVVDDLHEIRQFVDGLAD
jgi:hypothetical protein